jgi:hypothetical protein
LEQVQFNFSSPNKFTIVLPYGLLVVNNIFKNVPIGYADDGGYENRTAYVSIIIIKSKTMKILCWLL